MNFKYLRKSLLGCAGAIALLASMSPAFATKATNAGAAPNVLVVGDSLSAAYGIDESLGWVNLLRQKLVDQLPGARVFNASISGDTTSGGLARFEAAIDAEDFDWLILELGGNDGLRGLPLKDLKANLTEMITLAQNRGVDVLLVGVPQPPTYGAAYSKRFAKAFVTVAEETDVPLVPDLLEGLIEHPEWLQDDGIHPDVPAQPMMMENVWAVLSPLLSDRTRQ